jgi:hypothetical protein
MTNTLPIPTPDPMPLPAPVWLLYALLMLTFTLHVLAMNMALGGSVIAAVSKLRRNSSEFTGELGAHLGRILPVILAFTITLGVAALLFVQVLYGPLLYSSSILIGAAWISVIGLLIVGYYAFYWSSIRQSTMAAVFGASVLVAIGFIYSNNMSLMLTPERWRDLYAASAAGLNFNFGERTLIPRYLHMLLGALAVGGLLIVVLGLRERVPEFRNWLIRHGANWFAIATAINIVIGSWFLLALPPHVLPALMQSIPAVTLITLTFLLAIGAIAHLLLAKNGGDKSARRAVVGIGMTVATVAAMIFVRDMVRTAYLQPHYRLSDLPIQPQWGIIALFLLLFVAGLATLGWMLRKLATAEPQAAARAAGR